jgi:hypothetical protein
LKPSTRALEAEQDIISILSNDEDSSFHESDIEDGLDDDEAARKKNKAQRSAIRRASEETDQKVRSGKLVSASELYTVMEH